MSIDNVTSVESDLRDVLVVVAGQPGTGKTTIARLLARQLRAAYLRTDVIAGPMLRDGLTDDRARAGHLAYGIAREVATENLRAGVPVVVDGVHATHQRRASWRDVSEAARSRLVLLEMSLSDRDEHRVRVEKRQSQGYAGPSWEQIVGMEYDAWSTSMDGRRLVVDTFDTDAALARCLDYVGAPCPARFR